MAEREIRTFELRASVMEVERRPIIEGHAAVFNQPSQEIFRDAPGWREIIRPGAFSQSIKRSDDVVALFNHNDEKLIGRRSNGTLMLEEDEIGLKVRIFPPNTQTGNEVLELIRRKDITQMSFGFTLSEDGERRDHQNKLREIINVKELFDVSPVVHPAYRQTDVGLRVDPNFFSRIVKDLNGKQTLEEALLNHGGLRPIAIDQLQADDEKIKADFLARIKERADFISRRIPPPDPLSFSEILKNARIKTPVS